MKLIDKLKNIFFEEVEEDDEEELPQTFAKKVEVPKKKVEVPKKDIDFDFEEVKSVNNVVKEQKEESVPVDTKVDVEIESEKDTEKDFPMMFDDDDFVEDKSVSYNTSEKTNNVSDNLSYKRETREYSEEKNLYQGKKEVSYIDSVNNRPAYSYTKNYYEEKETKTFRPSPIISPIYGILDKNYHKEEVITKRETRIVSNYNKPDLDSVRNKAFGSEEEEKVKVKTVPKKEEPTFDDDYKKVYDVNNNKPQVNRVTLADADEYYNDLGLAYNVDYSDASRNTNSRVSKYNAKDKKKSKNNVDDNLFDLIDSMYNKEE